MRIPAIQGCMYGIDWGTFGGMSLVKCTTLNIVSCHCTFWTFKACALRQGLIKSGYCNGLFTTNEC